MTKKFETIEDKRKKTLQTRINQCKQHDEKLEQKMTQRQRIKLY